MKYTEEQKQHKDSFHSYKKRVALRLSVNSNKFKIKDGFVIFNSIINKN